MVDGISSSTGAAQYQTGVDGNNKMTDDQKKQLSDLLSKYDPATMDKQKTESLMEDIKSLGIKPGSDLKSAMEAKGFKMHHKGGHHHHGGHSSANAVQGQMPQFVQDFAKQLQAGNVNQDEIDNFIKTVQDSGSSDQGLFVDKKA